MSDLSNFISILIAFGALLISLYAGWRQYKTKKPEICFIKLMKPIVLKPNYDTLNFNAWIPLLFANNGDRVGTVLILDCLGYSIIFDGKTEHLELFRDDQIPLTNVLQLSSFSSRSLLVKVETTNLKIEDTEDWDDMIYKFHLMLTFQKTALIDKKISLISEDSDFLIDLIVSKFDYDKIEELRKYRRENSIAIDNKENNN